MRIHSGKAGYILKGEQINDITRQMVRKHHNAPSEIKDNIVTEYVNANKQKALLQYITEMGIDVMPYSAEHADFLTVQPTGGINDRGYAVELYLPFNKKELPTDITERHYARCQLNMLVTNKESCDFMIWMPEQHEIYTIERNNDWLAHNLPRLEKFYKYVQSELANPAHLESILIEIDDQHLIGLVDEYDQLKLEMVKAEDRQKQIIAELAEKVGRDAIIGGKKFVMQSRSGSISWKKAFDELQSQAGIEIDTTAFKGKDSSFWKLG